MKGITFLPVSKIFSTKRFPRNTERLIWEVSGNKGNVLRGCGKGLVFEIEIKEYLPFILYKG